jgi:hypothetical protein
MTAPDTRPPFITGCIRDRRSKGENHVANEQTTAKDKTAGDD